MFDGQVGDPRRFPLVYTGKITGNEIDGEVVHYSSTFPGGQSRTRWHGYIANAQESAELLKHQQKLRPQILQARYQGMIDVVKMFAAGLGAGNTDEARQERARFEKFKADRDRLENARRNRETVLN